MPCYFPLQAWRGKKDGLGNRPVVWNKSSSAPNLVDAELKLPCGQCIGCRLERSRQWAIRCIHEASLYERNCFLTLTYDNSHIPPDGGLVLRDFQLFMKRLRKYAGDKKIRFFHCGEYGEKSKRPHYHACVFNFDFDDKWLWSVYNKTRLYRSPTLERLWPLGLSTVGDVTFESAAYVARYVMKKVTGASAKGYYGERHPEYITMSRRPGIGRDWYSKYKTDAYPSDFLVVRGVRMKPPKFYDGLYETEFPEGYKSIKARRNSQAFKLRDDNDSIRLAVKEQCKQASISNLVRSLEA